MYTIRKNETWMQLEKSVKKREGDDVTLLSITVSHDKSLPGKGYIAVSGIVAPFRGETRHFYQSFWGDVKSAWELFRGLQALLGGEFID